MDALTLIARSLASMTLFALRPFLAAFCLAGTARIGAWAAAAEALPAWLPLWAVNAAAWLNIAPASLLISDGVLVLLALLAVFEATALAVDDLQPFYEQVVGGARVLSGFVITFGLVDQQMTQVLRALIVQLPTDLGVHGLALVRADMPLYRLANDVLPLLAFGLTLLAAALTAGGSWAIGTARSALGRLLRDLDSEDAIGLRGVLNSLDLLTSLISMVLFWYLPLVGLLLAALTLGGLQLTRRVLERREQQQLTPCVTCGAALHPAALFCAQCRSAQPAPRRIGLLGLPLRSPMRDAAEQQFTLISRKRCPTCAGRLTERRLTQRCSACATVTFADAAALSGYLQRLDRRVPLTLLGCLLFGLLPLIGLVPGLIFYRLSLVAALSGFVGAGEGCLTRWAVGLLNTLLILLQPLPLIGAATLPLLCLSNYLIYRTMLTRQAAALPLLRQ